MGNIEKNNFYYLTSTKDLNEIKYIGITSKDIDLRLSQHLIEAKRNTKNTHKNNWIRKEIREKHSIKINLFFYKYCIKEKALFIEDRLIKTYREFFKLTNSTKINYKKEVNPILRTKAVIALDFDGNYVCKFNSLIECANYFKVNNSFITNVIKKRKKSVRHHLLVLEKDYDPSFNYKYVRKKVLSPFHKDHPSYKKTANDRTNTVKIIRIDLKTNEEILFNSYADACRALNKKPTQYSNMVKVCKNERIKAFGYGWKFYEDIVRT